MSRYTKHYWKSVNDSKCPKCGHFCETKFIHCDNCRNKILKYQKKLMKKGLCRRCLQPNNSGKTRCDICRSKQTLKEKERRMKFRKIVFNHYGNKCKCCGLEDVEFLTVDHINNDGYLEKKSANKYKIIIDKNFPENLQLLCWNCNSGKAAHAGICPHESRRIKWTKYMNFIRRDIEDED